MATMSIDMTITMSTIVTPPRPLAPELRYLALHVQAERGESSIVTRDNVEKAALEAVSELMDRMGL